MNKYYLYSDEYKELHNIYYNGEYYTLKEIITSKELSNKLKIELIKKTLQWKQ
jgi:hypothetical protein|tara:strand:+ start:205 stop:363 length:159 start_codon:yes stop_codon:yes gene_type:complete